MHGEGHVSTDGARGIEQDRGLFGNQGDEVIEPAHGVPTLGSRCTGHAGERLMGCEGEGLEAAKVEVEVLESGAGVTGR